MVVPESTLGGLSGKHNFEGNQGGMWNLMTKMKENWSYCGFGQWFSVW